ncbi:MAG: shikimate kinase [Chitinophagaceae bacterium]|nr:shikimate kinase [Chitinophagaceae bacterium]
MGTGKTHSGKQLSEKLGIPFFDLDEEIVAHDGKTINEIFATQGEEYFRLLEKDVLHIIGEYHENFVMACGGGTPCYYNNIDYMNKVGMSIWLNTSLDTLYKRLINEKEKRPLIKELTSEQLRAYIAKKYSDRKIYYEQASLVMDEEEVEVEKIVEKIFHA